MNILIRCDSSYTIGAGHLMRDLLLAKRFNKDKVIFASCDYDGNVNHYIKDEGYKLKILKDNNVLSLIALVKQYKIDMVIIDNYDIDHSFEKELKNATSVKILSIDDTYQKHHCDILLNHNIGADEKKYKNLVPNKCEIRCGKNYTLIREEFIKAKNKQKIHIFISLGSNDSANITLKVLETIMDIKKIKIHIVTLSANPNIKKLKQINKQYDFVKLHIDSKKIAKLMRKCSFAIITPSVIAHEAMYMNLPIIAIQTQDNQSDIVQYLRKKNFDCLDEFDEVLLRKYVNKLILKIKNKSYF